MIYGKERLLCSRSATNAPLFLGDTSGKERREVIWSNFLMIILINRPPGKEASGIAG